MELYCVYGNSAKEMFEKKKSLNHFNSKELKVEYRIKTNGTLMNDEKMDFLIRNNFKIQVSLDGNKEAHDTHRKFANGKGSYELVDKVLRKLIDKNYSSKVKISATSTQQTIGFVNASFLNLNSYKGVEYDLKPVMPSSNTQYILNEVGYKLLYQSISKNSHQSALKQKQLTDNKIKICGIGVWNITIDVDGTIYPCYRMCGDKKYIIGTLDSFDIPFTLPNELVNIYQLEKNDECSKCYFLTVCKKGCYTDKLMQRQNDSRCIYPSIQIVKNMLTDDFVKNNLYKALMII